MRDLPGSGRFGLPIPKELDVPDADDKPRYLKRTVPYPCDRVIASLNALLFYGQVVPGISSDRFEELVDLAGCRTGFSLDIKEVHEELGIECELLKNPTLHMIRSMVGQQIPIEILITGPDGNPGTVLAVEYKQGGLVTANWPGIGTVLTRDEKLQDSIASLPSDRIAWALKLAQ